MKSGLDAMPFFLDDLLNAVHHIFPIRNLGDYEFTKIVLALLDYINSDFGYFDHSRPTDLGTFPDLLFLLAFTADLPETPDLPNLP